MRFRLFAAILALCAACAAAQTAPPEASSPAPSPSAPAPTPWAYTFNISGTIVAHGSGYAAPTFTADHKWTHIEARYNYEAQRTGSLWFGYDYSVGKTVTLEATPMIGGVFGTDNGVAPGIELTLGYKKLQLYSADEYVFDTNAKSSDFFYTWTQLTYSPRPWVQFGYAFQRTRAYHTSLDIQRGLLVGFTYKKFAYSTTFFNFGWTDPTINLSLTYSF
jgi:hypothetical protein